MLQRAERNWLKNTEVCDLLVNHKEYGLNVCVDPPVRPPGESCPVCAGKSSGALEWRTEVLWRNHCLRQRT